jgi:DNA-binding transcriptional LysR family regulator
MKIEQRDLEYFAVVAEHRNLGRAAVALGLSQPALSMSLRRLQEATGSKLVSRTATGVAITAAGSALLTHVHRLRVAHDDVLREIGEIEGGRVGHVTVGTTDGSSNIRLAKASAALLNDAPRIALSIIASSQTTLLPKLRAGELDLLVTAAPGPEAEDLAQTTLAPDFAVVYCSKRHPLARRKRVTLASLVGERWALAGETGLSHTWLRDRFQEEGLPEPQIALSSAPLELRLRLIASTRLIGLSARATVVDASERLGLTELAVRGLEPLQRRCVVIHRKDAYLSAAALRLMALLKETAHVASDRPREGSRRRGGNGHDEQR